MMFSKESLETLKEKVDLVEVISSYVKMSSAGAAYKALCPFHNEKTPSFTIQKGDTHYHCFGCGAHGDAIAFLMGYLKVSFVEAVETLAERFHVPLYRADKGEESKTAKLAPLREALSKASELFHFLLLHTEEGHEALSYLFNRGLDEAFVKQFRIGLAPKNETIFLSAMRKLKISDETLLAAGLMKPSKHAFFSDRVTFPIIDVAEHVIGFSARKMKEETFGPKYVNTPETALFKKSHVLFGYNFTRRSIAKERKAVIVEGQIDALRLIQEGFTTVVAGQGTAFGEGHVKELLRVGVRQVYLAFDGDEAGENATVKVGQLFQKEGVEVWVVPLPQGSDPDKVLREEGKEAFTRYLSAPLEYLPFLIKHFGKSVNSTSPAGKQEMVKVMTEKIQEWGQPLMIHEGQKQLAKLLLIPEGMIPPAPALPIQGEAPKKRLILDPDRILEMDLLRFLLVAGPGDPSLVSLVQRNVKPEDFQVENCRRLFSVCLEQFIETGSLDLLPLLARLGETEQEEVMAELVKRRVALEKAKGGCIEAATRLLNRNWLRARERILDKIQLRQGSDEERMELVKEFDALTKQCPTLV